jgi:hypothetical protein
MRRSPWRFGRRGALFQRGGEIITFDCRVRLGGRLVAGASTTPAPLVSTAPFDGSTAIKLVMIREREREREREKGRRRSGRGVRTLIGYSTARGKRGDGTWKRMEQQGNLSKFAESRWRTPTPSELRIDWSNRSVRILTTPNSWLMLGCCVGGGVYEAVME